MSRYAVFMHAIHLIVTIECPSGTYRSLTDDQGACLDCPMNTAMDVQGAESCSCLAEFFRDDKTNEGLEVDCTSKFILLPLIWYL